MTNVTIYHNPACGTSRNTLEMIRNSGTEPPLFITLKIHRHAMSWSNSLPIWGSRYECCCVKMLSPMKKLGLAEDKFTDDQLIDFMLRHPILINRPIVVTPLGTRLCRPSEGVLDILPDAQKGAFAKEDGEKVVDDEGKRLK
ncbi:Arsenate reductase [Klebsiella grimontii]|uniref:Arsenate reductase n=1 Tax=Klebsiella grimontii TaxID=2058152 RepID=A0A7H4NX51_9ENTR|nr:Arsenate reductase [Klebsiella grimontii]